jgi:hypothetical protein
MSSRTANCASFGSPLLHRRAAAASRGLVFAALLALATSLFAEEAQFYRAINLNGPAAEIDGLTWEAKDTPNFSFKGGVFENPAVLLKPPTDTPRAQMIRSSVWGNRVELELANVPSGPYQIFIYVWEDNHSERIDFLVNDSIVLNDFHSGNAGSWRRLGPWKATSRDGKLKVATRGGAANLSGLEVWSGHGTVPEPEKPQFLTSLTPDHTEFFERRVRPILVENCYECHSSGASKIGGHLLLDSRAGIMKGGDTGPAITPGIPEASLLIQAVHHVDPLLSMPPKRKLSDADIADLTAWVRMGAPDPRTEDTVASLKARSRIDWDEAREFWSFRPLANPPLPKVQDAAWPSSPIDHFILARLEK